MIAVYLRVSSPDQKVSSQRKEIEKYLKNHDIPQKEVLWFIDKETGRHLERPQFKKLQKRIFEGYIKTIIVYKLDRISRNFRDGINVISDWLEKDIRIISVTQQIDLSGAMGKMMMAFFFAMSEMELDTNRERQAAGIAVAKERDKTLIHKYRSYKGRKPGTLIVDPERVKDMRSKGAKIKELSQMFNVTRMSIHRYLNS